MKLVDTLDSKSGSFGSGGSSPPTGTIDTTNNEYIFLNLLIRRQYNRLYKKQPSLDPDSSNNE